MYWVLFLKESFDCFLSWTNGGILCLKVERQLWELSFWTQQCFRYGKFLGCNILCISGSHHLQLQVSQLTWVIEVESLHVTVGFQIFLESARHRLCGTILMLGSPTLGKSSRGSTRILSRAFIQILRHSWSTMLRIFEDLWKFLPWSWLRSGTLFDLGGSLQSSLQDLLGKKCLQDLSK